MDNQEYWKKRNELTFLQGEKNALEFANDLQKQYKQALKQIQTEIYIFQSKYKQETGIDMTEIRKLLNPEELKDFKTDLQNFIDYAKNNKLDTNYIDNLKLLEYKSKISRILELKTKIQFEIEKLTNIIDGKMNTMLSDTYEEGYYTSIFTAQQAFGIATSFTELNKAAIAKAVATEYMAENYKIALYKNKDNLMNILNQQIPQGIILGYNPKKVAAIAEKKLKTNYNSTVRLVRTEYNLILNEATSQGYKQCGISRYQILATLDNRTSEICQAMDGQIFDVNKKEVGVNYPPFHPNCRTTTIPYFESDEFDAEVERIARDEKGRNYKVPGNINYKQWKAGLKKQKDGKLKYQSK